MIKTLIIDAKEGILGRIASFAAKQSLFGKEVIIVNCNEALVTGGTRSVLEDYLQKRLRGGSSRNGPHYPNIPERIMKRTIRGMLPYKQGRGVDAFKRIKCYNKVPPQYESSEKVSLKREIKGKVITLKNLGGKL